jgi:RHS repeat-associated protein
MIYDQTAGIPAVLLEKKYVNSTTTYMFYVREPGGELLASFDAAETPNKYYYHFDVLGSTVLVTNGSGTVSDSFTYSAWGAVLNTPTNNQKPYQYVGKLGYYGHDADTQGDGLGDLLQLGVRFYDSEIGRFTQRDPIAHYRPGLDSFVYPYNNPTSAVDPFGMWASDWTDKDVEKCKKNCDDAYAKKSKELDDIFEAAAILCAGIALKNPGAGFACLAAEYALHKKREADAKKAHDRCISSCEPNYICEAPWYWRLIPGL